MIIVIDRSDNHSNLKRHSLSARTTSFIDPAIVESFEKAPSSFNGDYGEEDSNTMTSSHTEPSSIASSVIYLQRVNKKNQNTNT